MKYYILLIVPVIGLYFLVIGAPYLHDDFLAIVKNDELINGTFWRAIFSYGNRPLAMLVLWLQMKLSQTPLTLFHVSGILIHLINFWLVFAISRHIFPHQNVWITTIPAFIFAVHPLQTETVSYILQAHMTGLCFCFYLGAILLFLKRKFFAYLVVIWLGMGVKETMLSAPIIVLLLDGLIVHTGFKAIRYRIHFIAFLSWILIPLMFWFHLQAHDFRPIHSSIQYLLTQPLVVLKYIKLFFCPIGQNINHFVQPVSTVFSWSVCFSLVLFCLTLFLLWRLAGGGKRNVFWLLFFLGYLAPSSSFFPLEDLMMEHRMYGALFPLSVLLVSTASRSLKWFLPLLIFWMVTLCPLTISRNLLYVDGAGLWEDSVSKVTDNPKTRLAYGLHLLRDGKKEKGIKEIEYVVSHFPSYPYGLSTLVQIWGPAREWSKLAKLSEKKLNLQPLSADDLVTLGKANWLENKFERAEAFFREALGRDQNHAKALYGLAMVLRLRKETLYQACFYLEKSYQVEPDNVSIAVAYAETLFVLGKTQKAQTVYVKLKENNPRHPYVKSLKERIDENIYP